MHTRKQNMVTLQQAIQSNSKNQGKLQLEPTTPNTSANANNADEIRETDTGRSVETSSEQTQPEHHILVMAARGIEIHSKSTQKGPCVLIEAQMSRIPWAALENLYRCIWHLLQAALSATAADVQYSTFAQARNKKMYSSAAFTVSERHTELLTSDDFLARLELGLKLLSEPQLWVTHELSEIYGAIHLDRMLNAARIARDQLCLVRLPCSVSVEIPATCKILQIEQTLAPKRPKVISKRDVEQRGKSGGFMSFNHKLHFHISQAKPPVDISFDEALHGEIVVRVSRRNAPWLALKWEEEAHDGVVVARVLKTIKVSEEPLFDQ